MTSNLTKGGVVDVLTASILILLGMGIGYWQGTAIANDSETWNFIKAQRRAKAAYTLGNERIINLERDRDFDSFNEALGRKSQLGDIDNIQRELKNRLDQLTGYDFSKQRAQIDLPYVSPFGSRRYMRNVKALSEGRQRPAKLIKSMGQETKWLNTLADDIEYICKYNRTPLPIEPTRW